MKLLAVSPLELALHAAVLWFHLLLVLSVALLALSTTLLVIWVVEPAAMRLLQSWLHAPAVRSRDRLLTSPALWRLRSVVTDRPGDLERLAAELAHLDVNVLGVHVHPLERGALDELVVAAPASLTADALVAAVRGSARTTCRSGPRPPMRWPTGRPGPSGSPPGWRTTAASCPGRSPSCWAPRPGTGRWTQTCPVALAEPGRGPTAMRWRWVRPSVTARTNAPRAGSP
ncbi:hypothetical protein [Modestobacter marinus]|uniref:hypothetical protein n=1 Tax=Modestobacter marinus TaxID=477641 RepID=UPI001C98A849|nr:hypothetical protein [Modestobacter marinus]